MMGKVCKNARLAMVAYVFALLTASVFTLWIGRLPAIDIGVMPAIAASIWIMIFFAVLIRGIFKSYLFKQWLVITGFLFAILVLCIGLVVTGVSMELAFRLSRHELQTKAEEYMDKPIGYLEEHVTPIGLYAIERVSRVPSGVRFEITDAGTVSFRYCFGYFPRGPVFMDEAEEYVEYERISDRWYICRILVN